MMIEIDWTVFHSQYLNRKTIYVKEHEDSWDFYTADEPFTIFCHVKKKENQEENFLFIERYLSGQSHIVPVIDVHGYEKKKEEPEEIVEEYVEETEDEL
jgi:hypothetical protein